MNLLQIGTLVAASSCLLACGGNSDISREKVAPHALSDVVTVRESTFCEAMPPQNCVGEFGFTVDGSGNFTAGPSPAGTTITGTLTPEELASLQSALAPVVQSSVLECRVIHPPFTIGTSDILLTLSDGSTVPVANDTFDSQKGLNEVCFRNGEAGSKPLRDRLDSLLVKYYPRPFP
jgi:hypothetical protein